MRIRSQRGDTIMEVLICIAILSLILGAAYSLTVKSQSANLQAQERGVATNLVNKQLENLRGYVDANTKLPADPYFCLYEGTGTDAGKLLTKAIPEADLATNIPAECKTAPFYEVIVYHPSKVSAIGGESGGPYGVIIRWYSAGGAGKDEVKMFYRINTISALGFDNVSAKPQCDNGVDDDGEGGTDTADPGCSSVLDDSESPNPPPPPPPPSTGQINVRVRNTRASDCSGIVTQSDPAPMVNVNLTGPNGYNTTKRTDSTGSAIFSGLPDGEYSALVPGGLNTSQASSCTNPASVTVTAGGSTIKQIKTYGAVN